MPRELTDQEKKVIADHRLIADAIENDWELEFKSERSLTTNWLQFHRDQDYRPCYTIRRKRKAKPITGELAYLIREWFKRYDTMPEGCLNEHTANIVNRLKFE